MLAIWAEKLPKMSLHSLSFRRLVALCALFAGLAASSSFPYVKRHSLPSIPTGWTLNEEIPSADTLITLQIGLKQHRIDTLIKALYEVSDPDHERYGKHLTKEYYLYFLLPFSILIKF